MATFADKCHVVMVVVHVVQNTSTSAGKDTADAGAAGIAPIVQTPIVFWILEGATIKRCVNSRGGEYPSGLT